MSTTNQYEEYQGFDSLYIAEVTKDDATGFTVGTPEIFAPAGEISKSTKTDSQIKYYNNAAWRVISSEGADEIKISIPVPPVGVAGQILGKIVDTATGALLDDGVVHTKYFALGYRLGMTDGTSRYVWRHKGTFAMGDEKGKSTADKAESNGIELTYSGISTSHQFDYPDGKKRTSKAIVVDERDGKIDCTKWFEQVVTPANVSTIKKTV